MSIKLFSLLVTSLFLILDYLYFKFFLFMLWLWKSSQSISLLWIFIFYLHVLIGVPNCRLVMHFKACIQTLTYKEILIVIAFTAVQTQDRLNPSTGMTLVYKIALLAVGLLTIISYREIFRIFFRSADSGWSAAVVQWKTTYPITFVQHKLVLKGKTNK